MTGDRVEGLGDIYDCYKGSKSGFGVVEAFESPLHERTQQSRGGMEDPEAVLGGGKGEERERSCQKRVSPRSWRRYKVEK